MTSSFGWLVLDPEHRRPMMEAADQFRDQGTIDDRGFGDTNSRLTSPSSAGKAETPCSIPTCRWALACYICLGGFFPLNWGREEPEKKDAR